MVLVALGSAPRSGSPARRSPGPGCCDVRRATGGGSRTARRRGATAMVSRTACACVASPVTGDRSSAERITSTTRPGTSRYRAPSNWRTRIEVSSRASVHWCRAIDRHTLQGAVQALPVGGDPAGFAAVERQHAVAPDIALGRSRLGQAHLGRRIVGPAGGEPAADRAVALRHRVRRGGRRQLHGPAMAGGLNHPRPPYPSMGDEAARPVQSGYLGTPGRLFQDRGETGHGFAACGGVGDQAADEDHRASGFHHLAAASSTRSPTRAVPTSSQLKVAVTLLPPLDRLARQPEQAEVGEGHDAAAA